MWVERYAVTVTTDGTGAGSGYTPVVNGRVFEIRYVKTDFDNGSTMTVTGETTGTPIWSEAGVNASATRAPRQATHSTAGVAALYAGAGTAVLDYVVIANERIKIDVTAGGATKTGTYHVMIG